MIIIQLLFVILLSAVRWSAHATASQNSDRTLDVSVIADNQSSLSPIANGQEKATATTASTILVAPSAYNVDGATVYNHNSSPHSPPANPTTTVAPSTATPASTSPLPPTGSPPSVSNLTPSVKSDHVTAPTSIQPDISSGQPTSSTHVTPPTSPHHQGAVTPSTGAFANHSEPLKISTSTSTTKLPDASTSGQTFLTNTTTVLLTTNNNNNAPSTSEQVTHDETTTTTTTTSTTTAANPPLTGSPVSRTTEAIESRDNDTTGSVPFSPLSVMPSIDGHEVSVDNLSVPEVTSAKPLTIVTSTTTTSEATTSKVLVSTSASHGSSGSPATSGFLADTSTTARVMIMEALTSSPPSRASVVSQTSFDDAQWSTTPVPLPAPRIHGRKKVMNAEMLGVPGSAKSRSRDGGVWSQSEEEAEEKERVVDVEGVSIDEGMLIGGSEEEVLSSDGGEESVLVSTGGDGAERAAAVGGDGTQQVTSPTNHLLYFDFRRQCQEEHAGEVWWNRTYGGVIAVRLCPDGYTGKVYRMCYYGGSWGDVDFSECRVQQLIKLKHLLYYHVHKNLTDGFHSLADELLNSLQRYRLRSVDDYLESLDSLNIIINARVTLDFDVGQDFKYLKTILKISDILFSKFDNKWSFPQEQQDMVTMKMVQILHGMTHFANLVAEGVKRSSRSVVVFTDYPHIGLEARVIRFDQDYRITLPDSGSSILLPAGLYKVMGSNDKYVVVTTWYNGIAQSLHEDEGAVNSAIFATTIHPGHDTHFLSGPVTLTLSTTDKVEDDFYAECSYLRRTYNKSSLWSHVGCSLTAVHPSSVTCVCHHMANIAVIVRKQHHEGHVVWKPVSLIVIIGCAISLAALLSTFVAHVHVLRYDSSESSMILLNLLLAMTAAQIVFMGGIQATSSREVCEGVSIVLHYLYLVSSFWLLSHGIHVFLRTRSSKESPCSSHMRDYCLLSWVAPVVLVIVTFAVNPRGYEIKKYCWLSIEKGMLLSYIVPIFSLIMVNTALMVLVLKHLFETQPFMKKSEIDKARTSVRAGVILLPFFGVNWFLGVLAMEDRSTEIFETIFAISTSLQGFLIFLFYSLLHTDVRKAFRQFTSRILRRRKSSDLRLRRNRRRQAALDAEPLLVASETLEQTACGSTSGASSSSSIVAQCLPRPEEPFVLAEEEEDQAIARADIT